MAHSALRARLVMTMLCAGLLSGSALFIASCSDSATSPTTPRSRAALHSPNRDDGCGDFDEIGLCDPSDSGDDGDYIDDSSTDDNACTVRNHYCTEQPLDTTQLRLMDSVAVHISPLCGWVVPYIKSLSTVGGVAAGSFFGTATADWGPYDTGDTHSYSQIFGLGTGADYNARVHIRPSTFGNIQDLTKTVIHEAAHGYWGAPDPRAGSGIPYNSPGYAESFADACYQP